MSDLKKQSMELLYIWIEDFKNIRDVGFNFSGSVKFDYDAKTGSFIINKITSKNSLPENFWGDQIINLTAIVGENGAGKTNLMYFFNSFLGNYYCKAIIAFKITDEKKKETIQLFVHDKLRVTTTNNTDYEILPFERYSQDGQTQKIDLLNKINVIYFSNAIGVKAFWGNPNQLDISTSYILENLSNGQSKVRQLKLMDAFRLSELKKQMNFLEKYGKEFESNFGKRLNKIGGYFNSLGGKEIHKMLEELHMNREFLSHADRSFKRENNSSWHAVTNPSLIQVYLGLMTILNSGNSIGFSFIDLKLENIKEQIKGRLLALNLKNELDLFCYICELQESEISTLLNITEQYLFIDPYSIQFEISVSKFEKFLELYEKTLKDVDHLGFSWNLSSGENAYLNIFSRIHDASTSVNFNRDYPIWLLIDEGELYLHPQWQKSFTKNMIHFMCKIFEGLKFQMVFTSHSPLILSDFPKQSIIFIERTEDGLCKVSDMVGHEATFASNIYELYKDSFLLKGAFFGEYAEDQVNKLISFLSPDGKAEDIGESERMKFVLQSLGDDALRNKLISVWNKKHINDPINVRN